MNFHEKIAKYADIALKIGVNLQEGQTLVISSDLYAVDFVRILTKRAYVMGAKHVYIDWSDEEITRLKFELAPEESFYTFPQWKAQMFVEEAENDAAFLRISESGGNPDLLKGISPNRISAEYETKNKALTEYRDFTQFDKITWSIVAVPSTKWAEKVFPHLKETHAVNKLWEAIFSATRVNEPNPISAWQEHLEILEKKMGILNAKNYHSLHFKSKGTDLLIELPPLHVWEAGGSVTTKGINFVANIPTEEIFTAPKKTGVNGSVTSTRPVNYNGTLITDLKLIFKDGKVVDYQALEGQEMLKYILESDEGASYLGEVALLPYRSHLSNMDVTFFNTLFDENASTHLALGSAYPINIKDGNDMKREELAEHGLNMSIMHLDFMIGTPDLCIDGINKDSSREAIFKYGNWSI